MMCRLNRPNRRTGALVAAVVVGFAIAAPASAGTCPADKMRPDGTGEKMNATPGKDVTDNVLASIDLAKEPADVKDRLLRLRRLEIKAGGVVPWHEHHNRPAIIYIVQGDVTEYASTCAVPIEHHAGDVAAETHATAHWWKNNGKQTVVLLSADLFPTAAHDEHMM
jgi:quercetin dioxygenase-like cupin family protein